MHYIKLRATKGRCHLSVSCINKEQEGRRTILILVFIKSKVRRNPTPRSNSQHKTIVRWNAGPARMAYVKNRLDGALAQEPELLYYSLYTDTEMNVLGSHIRPVYYVIVDLSCLTLSDHVNAALYYFHTPTTSDRVTNIDGRGCALYIIVRSSLNSQPD